MWKTILLHLGDDDSGLALGPSMQRVAATHDAALHVLVASPLPLAPYGPGRSVLSDAYSAACDEVVLRANERAARAKRDFGAHSIIVTPHADRVALDCASHFRAADLITLSPPVDESDFTQSQVFDAALFASGRPVLTARSGCEPGALRRVAVAWKDCREAARAIHDAMPLLARAEEVRLISVHGAEDERFFGQPAMDRMLSLLAAHGVAATGRSIAAGKSGAGATLIDAADGADVIVSGAYGRWRLAEKLLGGMTRDLLANAPVPLLMSH